MQQVSRLRARLGWPLTLENAPRIGQTKPVHVYQMVAERTIEAKVCRWVPLRPQRLFADTFSPAQVLEIQDRKKNLIKQAFSGIKSRETERQKREARINGACRLVL